MYNYGIYQSKSKDNLKTHYSVDYYYIEMIKGEQYVNMATFEFYEYNGWVDTVYGP